MRILLLSVGKPRDAAAVALHDRYVTRITRLGVRYSAEHVAETRSAGRLDDTHVRRRDTEQLLARAETGTAVLLDRKGEQFDTRALADRIERWATPCLTLMIGGPLGLDPEQAPQSVKRWSLSPLTFPHELVRAVVVEQLYRALSILRGHPYHK